MIGGFNRGQIVGANGALSSNDIFGPVNHAAILQFAPDVGEHAGPAAIAVEERVDLNGAVVEYHRLVEDADGRVLTPEAQVVEQHLEAGFHDNVRYRCSGSCDGFRRPISRLCRTSRGAGAWT